MNLIQKQKKFSELYARLILYCITIGYEVKIGEVHRPRFTAEYYASIGKGIINTLHELYLAGDLILFKDGHYLTESEEYADAGEFWESLSTDEYECCWGGRFKDKDGKPKPDGGHFSITHNGVK